MLSLTVHIAIKRRRCNMDAPTVIYDYKNKLF